MIGMHAGSKDLPPRLLEHVQHLCLENVIYGFDRDGCSGLRHGEYVDTLRETSAIFADLLEAMTCRNLEGKSA